MLAVSQVVELFPCSDAIRFAPGVGGSGALGADREVLHLGLELAHLPQTSEHSTRCGLASASDDTVG